MLSAPRILQKTGSVPNFRRVDLAAGENLPDGSSAASIFGTAKTVFSVVDNDGQNGYHGGYAL